MSESAGRTPVMIPDEAVEAAAKCFIERLAAVELGYVDAEDPAETVIDVREFDLPAAIRAVLEAAAPYLKAEAWDEGHRACNMEWMQTADIVTPDEDRFVATNPYRTKEARQ